MPETIDNDSNYSDANILAPFDFRNRTRLVYGPDCSLRAGEYACDLGMRNILLVTDTGIVAAGHVERVMKGLLAGQLNVTVFDRVHENPTTLNVAECLACAQAARIDGFVALGGGSSMDTAKGCNFLLSNGGRMEDYWGFGKAAKPMLPLIAIPTTAGTGSECQSYALIAQEDTRQKMACGDPKAAAAAALLDPILTVSQPVAVTAYSGIDAIAHCVETAVTTKRNPLSLLYSHKAFQLAMRHFPAVLAEPRDLAARGGMLVAAAFAGLAIENSMLGAAHSAANPLTAHFGIVHGHAVGLMLPWIVRYNCQNPSAKTAYVDLAIASGLASTHASSETAVEALAMGLTRLLVQARLPATLAECGVKAASLAALAEEAARQWTAQFNPHPINAAHFKALYERALS